MANIENINVEDSFHEVFLHFRTTGFHWTPNSGVPFRPWPDCTYAVAAYIANGQNHYVAAQKNGKVHAEKYIIDYVNNLLQNKKLDSPKIKLFINYSPCDACCPRIIGFWGWTGSNVEVEIVFSGFYRLNRPSCVGRQECKNHEVPPGKHDLRVNNLKDLYRTEWVVLRTMRGQDWLDLATALGLDLVHPDVATVITVRTGEDARLESDFNSLVVQP